MKRLILQITMIIFGYQVLAQEDKVDSLLTDLFANDRSMSSLFDLPSANSFLFTGFSYDNRTYYAGREIGTGMSTLNGSAYFFHSSGIFAGVQGAWYSQTDPGYGATIISAGVRHSLTANRNLNVRIAYNRYVFNGLDPLTYIPYNNSISGGMILKNDWIGASLSGNLLFGNEKVYNLSPGIFSSINLLHFGHTGGLSLNPEANAFIGAESYWEYDASLSDSVNYVYVLKQEYGLLNFQIYLPLTINISNLIIEAGVSMNIPVTEVAGLEYPSSTCLSATIAYTFPISKRK